ncbi:RNA polymerase subunit sigma-70 [Luteipulveratus mongoliensis]|uniref:RNA polymerase sigma70 factor n=1 Tax=Luteipulveratus mongoliensis TaxID=571913 RepID=A0A0K1JRH3_9MICO|nr:RNA polymerase subunit sigma-70 [Luteipulveratus mongoliensis]AKU19312.1 RNA polymerase sigma70 factor [Luteipulveratus mongoliensis]
MTSTVDGALTAEQLETLRGPLTGYCYRMLGAAADTDDAVQESIVRAYRHRDRFDPTRARLSTWVHAIATNVCLDLLRAAPRRALLSGLDPAQPGDPLGVPLPPDRWVEPMPSTRVLASDPADRVAQRETVRLAFIAALQQLAPRQRAALLLRDVLAFSAAETATILETTVPAVNSALQRARAVLDAERPSPDGLTDPDDPQHRELLQRYVIAFESHDIPALTALLREDAASTMPPFAWWLRGRDAVTAAMGAADACAGDRLLLVELNGGLGLAQYRPADDGVLEPFALIEVEVRGSLISRCTTFLGSGARFTEFGLPAHP